MWSDRRRFKIQTHSRSLNILLNRLSKVYGSEPRFPWILLAVNNAGQVESNYPRYLIVQTQRIICLQVYRSLRPPPWYCKTGNNKAFIEAAVGSLHLFQQ